MNYFSMFLYVCLQLLLLHFNSNFGLITSEKGNSQSVYIQHILNINGQQQQQVATSLNSPTISYDANYFYPIYSAGCTPEIIKQMGPNACQFGMKIANINPPALWNPTKLSLASFNNVPQKPLPTFHGGMNYYYNSLPPFAKPIQAIVYGKVPNDENSLFSSIVQILNVGYANANQQKEQQQVLRRLTSKAISEDAHNLSGHLVHIFEGYIMDTKGLKFHGVEMENVKYSKRTLLRPKNPPALIKKYAEYMAVSNGNGDWTKAGSFVEILYAEQVLGHRPILTMKRSDERTKFPYVYKGEWSVNYMYKPMPNLNVVNWTNLFTKLHQNGLEKTLVIVEEGDFKYRPLYQIPTSATVIAANRFNLDALNKGARLNYRKW